MATEHRLANITWGCWTVAPSGYYASAWQSAPDRCPAIEVYQTASYATLEAVSDELHAGLCRQLRIPTDRILIDDHGQKLGHGHRAGI